MSPIFDLSIWERVSCTSPGCVKVIWRTCWSEAQEPEAAIKNCSGEITGLEIMRLKIPVPQIVVVRSKTFLTENTEMFLGCSCDHSNMLMKSIITVENSWDA